MKELLFSLNASNKGKSHEIFHGDNLSVLNDLLTRMRNNVKLIYLDPPFGTNLNYKSRFDFYKDDDKTINRIEQIEYNDTFSLNEYKEFVNLRIKKCYELLNSNGFLVFQCDPDYSHIIRVVIDKVFDYQNFRGEILVNVESRDYLPRRVREGKINHRHNSVLVYSKNKTTPLPELIIKNNIYRKSNWFSLMVSDYNENSFPIQGITPNGGFWKFKEEIVKQGINSYTDFIKSNCETIEEYSSITGNKNFIRFENNNFQYYHFKQKNRKSINESYWLNLNYRGFDTEYPTEKNRAFLKRLILWLTEKNDIVVDPFLGSGTTLIESDSLGRVCIGIDINIKSLNTSFSRFVSSKNTFPLKLKAELNNEILINYDINNNILSIIDIDFSFYELCVDYSMSWKQIVKSIILIDSGYNVVLNKLVEPKDFLQNENLTICIKATQKPTLLRVTTILEDAFFFKF